MPDRLSQDRILAAWELGAGRRPLDQALAILWAADGLDSSDLALRDRNRRLFEIHTASFGPQLDLVTECPGCDTSLELSLRADDMASDLLDASAGREDRHMITSRNLAAVFHLPLDQQDAALAVAIGADTNPEALQDAVDASEITLSLNCAECGHQWAEPLDPVAPVWANVVAVAHSALQQVALLARAYGWTESEILRLNPMRRAAYLRLAGEA